MVYTCLHHGLCWSRTKDEQMHDFYCRTTVRRILLWGIKVYIILDIAMSFNTESAEVTTSFTALIKRHAGYGYMWSQVCRNSQLRCDSITLAQLKGNELIKEWNYIILMH